MILKSKISIKIIAKNHSRKYGQSTFKDKMKTKSKIEEFFKIKIFFYSTKKSVYSTKKK
jgi:hypothetical protein